MLFPFSSVLPSPERQGFHLLCSAFSQVLCPPAMTHHRDRCLLPWQPWWNVKNPRLGVRSSIWALGIQCGIGWATLLVWALTQKSEYNSPYSPDTVLCPLSWTCSHNLKCGWVHSSILNLSLAMSFIQDPVRGGSAFALPINSFKLHQVSTSSWTDGEWG